jgi:stage V sporulation protein D (sporulation-specific penicillin-binding protein)
MADDAVKVKKTRNAKNTKNAKKARAKVGLLVRTMFLLAVCGIVAFFVLAARLYDLQITNSAHYEALALSNQLSQTTLTASRGTIYDTNGKILAMSAAVENVFISPFEIDQHDQNLALIANGLSTILEVERDSILEKAARTNSMYQVIMPRVENDKARQIREFISEHKIRGVYLEPATKRYYPNNNLASHVIGFVGTENIGLDGLELQFDDFLTGVSGRKVRLTNARGANLMFSDFEDHFDALDGYNITLTIDSSVQYFVEKHLEQAILNYDVLNGAMCIAMNARTGAILAIANYPNYDPNDFLRVSDREMDRLSLVLDEDEFREELRAAQFRQWRNRSLSDTYEPGSVFKVITYAMALEEGIASPGNTYNCAGSMQILGSETNRHCWRRRGHGLMTLEQAMESSCNIVCIQLGLNLGSSTFYKYIDAFGLFNRTGLDNRAEGRSIWWEERVFFDARNHSQLASASFGQTFKVTPIQMITAVTATINGGFLMQPYIVSQITDSSGNIIESTEPTVVRQVISGDTSAIMRGMLEDVVRSGTGRNAQVMGYRIGGKTGTSENTEQMAARGEDDNSRKDYIVSFVGFAPADDPEIVILLLLDTPSHDTGIAISGGSMAAPVVGNMLADILPLSLGVVPQYTEDNFKDINVHVPRVIGRNVEDAEEMLIGLGFEVTVVGEGASVDGQLPMQNAHVASGTMVIIYAGEEVPMQSVTVPQLFGMNYSDARRALESAGMFIRATGAPRSDGRVRVSVQSIPAGPGICWKKLI